MEHAHKTHVIDRDRKYENSRLDVNGTLMLFDFGLAPEVVKRGRRMTPCTSSLHYTAPANVRSGDYGFPANVDSFGVLSCELMALVKPLTVMGRRVFLNAVDTLGVGPKVEKWIGSSS